MDPSLFRLETSRRWSWKAVGDGRDLAKLLACAGCGVAVPMCQGTCGLRCRCCRGPGQASALIVGDVPDILASGVLNTTAGATGPAG